VPVRNLEFTDCVRVTYTDFYDTFRNYTLVIDANSWKYFCYVVIFCKTEDSVLCSSDRAS